MYAGAFATYSILSSSLTPAAISLVSKFIDFSKLAGYFLLDLVIFSCNNLL